MEEISISSLAVRLLSLITIPISFAMSIPMQDSFVECFSHSSPSLPLSSQVIHSQDNSSYTSILQSTIQNLRFLDPTTPKPLFIITPSDESHVKAAITCSRLHGLNLRVRSGGHDYEGLSYLSSYTEPFILLDLNSLRSITINLTEKTMWIQAGATIGEVYHRIAQASNSLGFPGGVCPSVGVGGLFGGGGLGTMMRKYGLSADHILDACLIDADGQTHDRNSMGEDVFWAIRGGGALSFGVVVSWKIRLVPVPPVVTVFTITKPLEQGETKLVEGWQRVAHAFDDDLFIRVIIQPQAGATAGSGSKALEVLFNSLFLGGVGELLPLMVESFPELGLEKKDCLQMSWIESVLYFAGLPFGPGHSIDVLLDRSLQEKVFYKGKSDFVEKPISRIGLEGIWDRMLEEDDLYMIMEPLGGRMDELAGDELPFPFRKGYLYNMQYVVRWSAAEAGYHEKVQKHIDWIRRLHEYLRKYVSKSPRGAYVNYRDLDLGMNKEGKTSYSTARVWGEKYFGGNFRRLASVKAVVDPTNFFVHEQSIPPLVVLDEE